MKNQDAWIFISVFPNLSLRSSFETKYAAIVPYDDSRVKLLRNNHKQIDDLLESFIDTRLNKIKPNILIVHKKTYTKIDKHDAIISFRNIIALSAILDSWIPVIYNKYCNVFSTLFSDYFDFFPLDGYGNKLYFIKSPAINTMVSNAKCKYQSSYSLPCTKHFNLFFDQKLFNSLIKIWEEYFIKRQKNNCYSSLFRSLQVAFSACKMPTDNSSTSYDYGTKVCLWVSAFEILFHPGKEGKVGYKSIIHELNKYKLFNSKIRDKIYTINNNIQTNIIGYIYYEIYKARNDYFHGNIVDKNGLYIFKQKRFPLITHISPIIYLIALYVFLQNKDLLPYIEPKNLDEKVFDYIMSNRIEDIFIQTVKKKIITVKTT